MSGSRQHPLKRFLKRRRAGHILGQPTLLGKLLVHLYGVPEPFDWFVHASITIDDAILDVGCGAGGHLISLYEAGFSNLTGIEPHLDHDLRYANGVSIFRQTLDQVPGPFGFIMFHHSFEHLSHPLETLRHAYRLLGKNRFVLLRTPVADCPAWKTYGADWVQLDPPRHLFVPSARGLSVLAQRAGFELTRTVFDSQAFQFWGSEQYRQDIPLTDERSYSVDSSRSIFKPEQMQLFEQDAVRLNAEGRGDQAVFHLQKR